MIINIVNFCNPVGITNQIIGLTWTHGHTRGGIRCRGGVNIPCRLATPAVISLSDSGKRSNPQSKSVCQGRSNKWNEVQLAALSLMEGYTGTLDRYNDRRGRSPDQRVKRGLTIGSIYRAVPVNSEDYSQQMKRKVFIQT
jgi:hypothetical protein